MSTTNLVSLVLINIPVIKKPVNLTKTYFKSCPKVVISTILAPARVVIFNLQHSQQSLLQPLPKSLYFNYFGSCKDRCF